MADVVEIQTSDTLASYEQRTTLDGTEYVLRCEWSERNGDWYVQVRDADDEQLTGFVRVVLNVDLLRLYRGTGGLPPGPLAAIDHSGQNERPGFGELGRRVRLVYVEGTQ